MDLPLRYYIVMTALLVFITICVAVAAYSAALALRYKYGDVHRAATVESNTRLRGVFLAGALAGVFS